MSDHNSPTVLLSVDIKKYRIRIHKATLHLLGDPPYIQLLINPSSSVVALKSVSRSTSKDQTHRVPKKTLRSSNSVEIYSKYFIDKLIELVNGGGGLGDYYLIALLDKLGNGGFFHTVGCKNTHDCLSPL